MSSFPEVSLEIDGELRLAPFTIEDVPALLDAVADPHLRHWLPLPDPYTRQAAEAWCTSVTRELRDSGRGLVLAVRRGGDLAGCIDAKRVDWRAMTAELGYWAVAEHRGRGVAARAVHALSCWLIEDLGFERIELRIAPENTSSIRVAEKVGFVREGLARNAGFTDAGRVDLAIFSRVPGDLASRGRS